MRSGELTQNVRHTNIIPYAKSYTKQYWYINTETSVNEERG